MFDDGCTTSTPCVCTLPGGGDLIIEGDPLGFPLLLLLPPVPSELCLVGPTPDMIGILDSS